MNAHEQSPSNVAHQVLANPTAISIHSLPNDVYPIITQFLSNRSLLSFQRSNKHFYQHCRSPICWRQHKWFIDKLVLENAISSYVPSYQYVSSIEVSPNLSSSDIEQCLSHLTISSFPYLTTLSVHILTDTAVEHICHTNMKSLNVQQHSQISKMGFEMICNRFPTLTELKLPCTRLNQLYAESEPQVESGVNAFPSLARLTSLTSLDLSQSDIDDIAMEHISTACINLRTLNVSGCQRITDMGISSISSIASLTELNVNRTNMTGEGMKYVSQMKPLQTLDLFITGLSSNWSADIAFPYLTKLRVPPSTNDISLSHCIPISLPNLQELHLAECQMTDAGLVSIIQFHSLRSLTLSKTNISDSGLKFLSTSSLAHSLHELNILECNAFSEMALSTYLPHFLSLQQLAFSWQQNATLASSSEMHSLTHLNLFATSDFTYEDVSMYFTRLTKLQVLILSDWGGKIDMHCLLHILRALPRLHTFSFPCHGIPFAVANYWRNECTYGKGEFREEEGKEKFCTFLEDKLSNM